MDEPETAGPYVAPARYPLTVLHRKDPVVDPCPDPADGEPVDGWTVCGTQMKISELWQSVEYRDGDVLCGPCFLEPDLVGAAEDAEGVLF